MGTPIRVKVKNVQQGHADVFLDGTLLGFVEQGRDRGYPCWWAYDTKGKRVTFEGADKRAGAIRQLIFQSV